jgi:hypothetical protein
MANDNRSETLLAAISPYLKKMVDSAPEYGYCGIDIVFHAGKPVKIEQKSGVYLKPELQDTHKI